MCGVLGACVILLPWDRLACGVKLNRLGRRTVVGESPVDVSVMCGWQVAPSSAVLVECRVNLAGPPVKPKYFLVTDSVSVP